MKQFSRILLVVLAAVAALSFVLFASGSATENASAQTELKGEWTAELSTRHPGLIQINFIQHSD